jgi:hypothetical protein
MNHADRFGPSGLAFRLAGYGSVHEHPSSTKEIHMRAGGIGLSIFLMALGAILYWAVSADVNGVDINLVGLILMIVGVVGLILSIIATGLVADRNSRSDVTIIDR